MSDSQQATKKKPFRKKMKKYLNMLKGILAIIGAVTVVLIIGYLFEHQLYYRGIQKKLDSGYTLYNFSGKTSKLKLRGCNAYQPDLSSLVKS